MRARDNPFRAERLSGINYRLTGASWEDLLTRFQEIGSRAAVVGPEGRGKTTLVEGIGRRLREKGLKAAETQLWPYRHGIGGEEAALIRQKKAEAELKLSPSGEDRWIVELRIVRIVATRLR